MALLHPLPHDLTAWTYQLASFGARFRAIAIDLPGHGRSPRAPAGITLPEVAAACWRTIDEAAVGGPIVIAGCSVGATVAKYMAHARPGAVAALALTGGGYHEGPKGIAARHLAAYRERPLDHKRDHLFANFSPGFAKTPLAGYFVALAMARNGTGDVEGTLRLIAALEPADPAWLHHGLRVPTIVVAGGADRSLPAQRELSRRIDGAELAVIAGAGHSCMLERPEAYDRIVLEFLARRGLV